MQKVNQLFNKEVINQVTGEKLGTVQDVVLDTSLRSVVALMFGKTGLFQQANVARWKAVTSIGDVVVLQATTPFPLLSEEPEIVDLKKQAISITGTPVINANGESLGTVSDIFINERGEVTGYAVKPGVLHKPMLLAAEHVQASGKDAIIATATELSDLTESEPDVPALIEPQVQQTA